LLKIKGIRNIQLQKIKEYFNLPLNFWL
jgi:hypothetical protein